MTIKALEGTLVVPTITDPALNLTELGWRPQMVPSGQCVLSEVFFPDPTNDPAATVTFNVFIVATTFDGDIYLVKRAPSGSMMGKRWFRPIRATAKEFVWSLRPSEAIADTIQETENSVSYALAMFGTVAGQQAHYRFSL